MKLQEVCALTGLTRKTIRFYEEKGLIAPQTERRNGRTYREYTQTDVDALLEIATLRKAWFTIEEIHQMQADPLAIRDIFPQYRQWLRQQKQELDMLLAVAEQIDEEDVSSIQELTQVMADAATRLPLPPLDIKPRFRYLDELEERPAVLPETNPINKVLRGSKLQHQLAAYSAGDQAETSLMTVDMMHETAEVRKHPESRPAAPPLPEPQPGGLRTWQRRLLIAAILMVVLSVFFPHVYLLEEEYTALCCSNEAYESLTEEFRFVTLRFQGIYFSTPFGNDRYYGTIHILDYPRKNGSSGGKFEPLELSKTLFDCQVGGLWYYSEKRQRYQSLGLIHWNFEKEQIFIHTENDYVVYPAQSVADADALWTELTAH